MTNAEPPEDAALASLLDWYLAMGVDAALDEEPHDRFQAPASPRAPEISPPAPARPRAEPARVPPDGMSASAEALIREAEDRARHVADLDGLQGALESLPGLSLAASARMIFAAGPPRAPLMILAGAPETDDERQGLLFAGAAGRLLDGMLRAIGLTRESVRLAPLVPWRPPGNRPPTPIELSLCLPFARRHIALVAPKVILCLGERAAQPLLATSDPISRLRGRWFSYEDTGRTTKLLATYSPTYLLSQPLQKRRAWSDLRMLARELSAAADA